MRASSCLYLQSVMHQSGDEKGGEAECNEAVLHVLHDGRQDDQVRVERVEHGAVDVAALNTGPRQPGNNVSPHREWTTKPCIHTNVIKVVDSIQCAYTFICTV